MHKSKDYRKKFFSVLADSISTLEGYSVPKSAVYYDTAHKVASGVLTPLDTTQRVVVGHKAAVLTGHLRINGEQLNEVSALRALLFNDRRGSGFSLASF